MSVHVAAAVYRARFGSPMRKALAVKLADISNDDGASIFMSVGRMARELEMGERTVQRLLREFVTEGILVVEQLGGRGPKSTTHYRLDLEIIAALPRTSTTKGAAVAPLTKTSRVPAETAKGATDDKKGAAVAPNPSLPVKDPSDSERGAQARPAPADDDVRVVEAEIIERAKGRAKTKRKRPSPANDNAGQGFNLFGEDESAHYRPGKGATLEQAMDAGWSPGARGLHFAETCGFDKPRTMQIFEAFKKKYRGVAGSAKSTDWWETWEGYVGAWKRNDDKSARESGRGGRFSVTDHLSN